MIKFQYEDEEEITPKRSKTTKVLSKKYLK